MKKNMLIGLVTLGAVSLLCGFDSAETADGVLQKMNEASASMESMEMGMDMNLDAGINIGDGTTTSTIAIAMNADFDMAMTMAPYAMQMDGSMKLSTFGQAQEMTMKMYAVTTEDGAMDMYVYGQESADIPGTWEHTVDSTFDMNQIMELSKTFQINDYSQFGLTFELAPEAIDVNGTECYQLSATVDKESLNTMLSKVSELTGQDLASNEEMTMALSYLDGLQMNMVYYVDAATYNPVSMHIDMNGSDLTTLNALLASTMAQQEGTTAELVLNDFSIDMTPVYNSEVEITVPAEALAAANEAAAE